jgi:preprotein translocase YajC subunit
MSDASLISAVVVAIVAYMYFTIIRPARQDQARHRQQIRDLRPGDQVLTTSNFVAKVMDIKVLETGRTHVLLEIAEGVVVTALPGAIIERLQDQPAAATAESPATEQKGASA